VKVQKKGFVAEWSWT